ncbi:MAG: hypothetical protein A2509_00640 [Candidatus Edwardsbacteria bacterium RIFOXYD12_FULL_50_11]|uniref:Uncharacterized protein n=1 Tax=Candidatus Edwardsbacteria bacterium GWF2_54_11 TaxID=1817851 RepID=A0A1F5RC16_9BACT|nr:MAG: hypothetical protein A2502_07835 [Candidatus Edwardsbacteria bacterium RifOxyC12_full_54_24]OGF07493.1 MAG: hypothetical protein A2273_03225 [Candidatus Edwardsbacteria bacterium RifOxyA12_full_54_48]OGF09743.1 MAG: hypothetical protein A3K15_09635 [Candidatus Edwardsbacteria bacterium GWE2_54_12]OGF12006.1 MAG: hypothetical protein A2024_03190 [Candidatus Edwardsbacteria bacterium GWF2_54_11]OGF16104.1 MAG: hypothetical protein A2509_00640 [Candidatus Edwardsbacteria bacterium RIFOXYD1
MEFKYKCDCGGRDFLMVSEKSYNARVDAEGTLVCLPQTEHIVSITCTGCSKAYKQEDFKQIEY